MQTHYSRTEKFRYYISLSLTYTLVIGLGWFAFNPPKPDTSQLASFTQVQQTPVKPIINKPAPITGKPVRVVIPASGVDLPVDEGFYNEESATWTLSGERAQFAMGSSLANNDSGDTFIYGHNNNAVFGALRHNTPELNAEALVYTDNGRVFRYVFQASTNLAPDDTSALNYQGPSVLTIQTCTGSFNEWRTLYRFSFDSVVT